MARTVSKSAGDAFGPDLDPGAPGDWWLIGAGPHAGQILHIAKGGMSAADAKLVQAQRLAGSAHDLQVPGGAAPLPAGKTTRYQNHILGSPTGAPVEGAASEPGGQPMAATWNPESSRIEIEGEIGGGNIVINWNAEGGTLNDTVVVIGEGEEAGSLAQAIADQINDDAQPGLAASASGTGVDVALDEPVTAVRPTISVTAPDPGEAAPAADQDDGA